jgi:hypothetical protein
MKIFYRQRIIVTFMCIDTRAMLLLTSDLRCFSVSGWLQSPSRKRRYGRSGLFMPIMIFVGGVVRNAFYKSHFEEKEDNLKDYSAFDLSLNRHTFPPRAIHSCCSTLLSVKVSISPLSRWQISRSFFAMV